MAKLNDDALYDACIEGFNLGFHKRVEPFVVKLLTRIDDNRQVVLFEKLARIYLNSKRYKKALMVLEQALQKFPKQASLYAWYGKLLKIYGKQEEADRVLNHANSLGFKASEVYK